MKVKVAQSCLTLPPHEQYSPWNFPGQNTEVGGLSLLQRICPTQGSSPSLLHCRSILYQLSHKGSPRKLEWVAYPFASRSPWPRNRTGISCIASGFFTNWVMREAPTVNFQDLKKQNLLLSLTSTLWDYFLSSMVVWEYLALKFFVASNI